MRRLSIGVLGHVDHGKTALVRALTGMETDRLAEEQSRGISIALGFAHLARPGGFVDFIDMPGHERFVRTAVSGATGIDAVLLVVDAGEGVMPQTREHVDIASLLGVQLAVVAVSRADLAPAERCAETAAEAALLVAAGGLAASAPVLCSARTGVGLDALLRAVDGALDQVAPREDRGAFWLPIDRVFSRAGHGTIVTGTLRRGALATGDAVEIVPSGLAARIRGLQVHGAAVSRAEPGQRVAVNLRHVELGDAPRGAALASPGSLSASSFLSVQLRSVADAPALASGARLRLLFGTAETEARLRLLDCDALRPGATALAQLACAAPVALPARERFILRGAAPLRTLAGGLVLDAQTTRQRRHAPAVLTRLAQLAAATAAEIVGGEVERCGIAGVPIAALARLAGMSAAQAVALLDRREMLVVDGGYAVSRAAFDALCSILARVLAPRGQGLAREAIGSLVAKAGPAVLDAAIAHLLQAGVLAREGGLIRLRRAEQDREARARTQAAARDLAARLQAAGLAPPDLAELAPDPQRRRLIDALVREGILVRASDRVQKRELVFHRDAIAAARRLMRPLLGEAGLPTGQIGAALGISRKFSVPLLEHLDAVGFTRRLGDRRVLAKADG